MDAEAATKRTLMIRKRIRNQLMMIRGEEMKVTIMKTMTAREAVKKQAVFLEATIMMTSSLITTIILTIALSLLVNVRDKLTAFLV
jgi:hypothetical protein